MIVQGHRRATAAALAVALTMLAGCASIEPAQTRQEACRIAGAGAEGAASGISDIVSAMVAGDLDAAEAAQQKTSAALSAEGKAITHRKVRAAYRAIAAPLGDLKTVISSLRGAGEPPSAGAVAEAETSQAAAGHAATRALMELNDMCMAAPRP